MQELTPAGQAAVANLAHRFSLSTDAVRTLLSAVNAGGGTMAQFYHPELGGGGQWMRGGMTMVGDMFNQGLSATVNALCTELSNLLASTQVFAPIAPAAHEARGHGGGWTHGDWWPAELGQPSSSGGQNDAQYAYFPQARRLALNRGGRVTLYDALDHDIGGVQQQQGGPSGSLSFTSQRGTFTVDSLPVVNGQSPPYAPPPPPPAPPYSPPAPSYTQEPAPSHSTNQPAPSTHQLLEALERLGNLHKQGVVSDDEFRAKKAELLGRL